MEINENKEISFSELFFILKNNTVIISIIISSFLLASIVFNYFQYPVYKSNAMIMITNASKSLNIFDLGLGGEKNFLENEIKILLSETIAERTVKELINSPHSNNLYLLETRKIDMIDFINVRKFLNLSNTKSPEIDFSNLNSIPDSVISYYSRKLQNQIKISSERNSDMINISVTSNDPNEAALLANTVVEVYRKLDLEWVNGEMSNLKTFLTDQIDKKELQLINSENELKRFQETEKIFSVDDNSKLLLANLLESESEMYKVKAEKNIISERKKYIVNELTEDEANLVEKVSNTINERLLALKNEIAQTESELIFVKNEQGEDHKYVNDLENRINRMKLSLESETKKLVSQGILVANPIKYRQAMMDSVIALNSRIVTLSSKDNELEKLVNHYEKKLIEMPEKVLKFTSLSRNLSIHTETYSLMRQKLEEASINEASQIGKVRVVDFARLILEPIKPRKKLNMAIGFFLGIFSSVMIVFLREYFDRTVKSIDEIERKGLAVLALIPKLESVSSKSNLKKYKTKSGNAEKIQRRMITTEDPKSPISEAYRGLRTSLQYSSLNNKDKDGNIILISSPGPGEGKTTTIVNLAITYANLGKKTLLIDADLRKPVVHKIFNLDKNIGLTQHLVGFKEDKQLAVQDTGIKNLSAITSGVIPPNPSEILASENMKNLIGKLKKEYDIILIDSPPLLAVTDAFICLNYTDQFILVVRAGKTDKAGLDRSINQINRTESSLVGVVVNAVDESNTYGQGYYYSYYKYYGESS